MKSSFKSLALFALLIFLHSCSQQKNLTSEESTEAPVVEAAFFTPNPQAVPEQEIKTLPIGSKAPNFKLPGVDGKYHALSEYDNSDVLVIVFTCNHCPTAQAYEERIKTVTSDYKNQGVQVIAISQNSIRGIMLHELGYTDLGDSFEDMIVRAEDQNFNFPYLYDGDDHAASLQYGPIATPHVFVFNKERILTYVGRLDGKEKVGSGNAEDLRAAIDSTLKGEPVALSTTKTFGCSTKWAWKDKLAKKVNKEWAEKEVSLEEVDTNGLSELLVNNSENLRLINFWATWCGPCVAEYPDFIEIHRMFTDRGFEFVSVSADNLGIKDKVHSFLKKKTSAVRNFIYNEEDKYAMIEAIDPEWDGALPYTVLVEPGGQVVYKMMGSIDPFQLKKIIVDHPSIGRYFDR
ncbi:MAG: redoxin domain-containing protein [Cyclobacteriaceae bacterium]|jgi:peroxiredoxin|nr:redoxin domain-containing protein [Cyclobacteriaceae bacterium]